MRDLHSCVGNAELFPILKHWDFYNHAGVSPLPHTAAQAFIDYAAQIETAAYVNAGWHPKIAETRQLAAKLIHADMSEIAFVRNTSEGLSIVANGIDWKNGDRIVTTNVEYPANVYPWMSVSRRYGVDVVMVKEETTADGLKLTPVEKILEAAKDDRTKLIALSHVEFASGQRHDLKTIGKFCRERGILLSVDGIQSVGAVPVNVAEMNIDYLSADGHKWMLAPEGAGVFYCRKDLIEKTRPLTIGWMNVVGAMNFDEYDFTLKSDAGRFESGSHNVAGLLAMRESLALLVEVGMEAISNRLKLLGDLLISGAAKKGYAVASPREGEQWSGIVSLHCGERSAEEIVKGLKKERVEVMVRHGRLRVAPHFYNTEGQIERLVGLLPGG